MYCLFFNLCVFLQSWTKQFQSISEECSERTMDIFHFTSGRFHVALKHFTSPCAVEYISRWMCTILHPPASIFFLMVGFEVSQWYSVGMLWLRFKEWSKSVECPFFFSWRNIVSLLCSAPSVKNIMWVSRETSEPWRNRMKRGRRSRRKGRKSRRKNINE